ncbi:deoxycytidylate deaminase isoform X1 [Monodon monoceros]|uniref:deoxycytidylate deaminase isoform X1 n=2 Tax=Monodon monoceros TaxID=40151 RepID=UPI0010F44E55|nr:deoxycytidylate deaminase isoform X1 [Monodon monoceros]
MEAKGETQAPLRHRGRAARARPLVRRPGRSPAGRDEEAPATWAWSPATFRPRGGPASSPDFLPGRDGGTAAAAGTGAGLPSMSEFHCKKRDDYLEWPEYFMAVAFLSAQRSKDPNSQVGACIVNAENKIVGIGYNGMPNGCSDDLLPWRRTAESILDTKYPYVCHAELNAIMNKNSADVKGCTMYVALFPCNECAKLIIQAGIKEVIFMSDKYHDSNETRAARLMLEMAGVSFRKFTPKCSQIVIDFDSINSRPSQTLQ